MVTLAVNPPWPVVGGVRHVALGRGVRHGDRDGHQPARDQGARAGSARARRGPDSLLHTFMPLISLGETGPANGPARTARRASCADVRGATGFRWVPDPDGRLVVVPTGDDGPAGTADVVRRDRCPRLLPARCGSPNRVQRFLHGSASMAMPRCWRERPDGTPGAGGPDGTGRDHRRGHAPRDRPVRVPGGRDPRAGLARHQSGVAPLPPLASINTQNTNLSLIARETV